MKRLFSIIGLMVLALAVLPGGLVATAGDQLVYGTYLGGLLNDQGQGIAADSAGNAYVTGMTNSTAFPTAPPESVNHGVDAFVARFDPAGSAAGYLYWFNALSLYQPDEGLGIAVDGAGNAYVVGQTSSADFCQVFGTLPGYDTTYNGDNDAFVLKIRADGSGLDYCTFLGGSDWDVGRAIAVDTAGNVTVAGGTWSTDFPVTPDGFQTRLNAQRDSFLARLDSTGTVLVYGTYLGGSGQEEAQALAVDAAGNAFVTGWTNSADFPTTPLAFDPSYGGAFDAYLVKLSTSPSGLVYATFLGGQGEDRPTGLDVDAAGHAYVAGHTQSPDFPTTAGALDGTLDGAGDGFVLKVSPGGSALAYSTFLGGSDDDWPRGLEVDDAGRAYVTGETASGDFPTTLSALMPAYSGAGDAFVAQLHAAGTGLAYGTYLGGGAQDKGLAIAADGTGLVYLTGGTESADFPTTPTAYDPQYNGNGDSFVVKLALPVPSIPPQRLYLPVFLRNG